MVGPVIRVPCRRYHSLHSPTSSRSQPKAFKAGNEGRYDIQVTSMTIPICRVLYRKKNLGRDASPGCEQRGRSPYDLGPPISGFEKALSTHVLHIHNPNDIHRPCCCVGPPPRTLNETAAPAAKKRGCRSSCRRGGTALIPKRLPERRSASLVVAKEEKRAARGIEQGTGLVDLRHFPPALLLVDLLRCRSARCLGRTRCHPRQLL